MTDTELSIMPTNERGYHAYHLEAIAIDRAILFAEEMLALAAYVEANRAQLEKQAQENAAKEQRAWDADEKDMQQIRREWEAYRHEDDETPPYKFEAEQARQRMHMTPKQARELLEQVLDVDRQELMGWQVISELDPFTRENAQNALSSLRVIEGQPIKRGIIKIIGAYMTGFFTLADDTEVHVKLRLIEDDPASQQS